MRALKNMAAPMELRCWGAGWGLPSVHTETLIVLAYAKFSGADLKIHVVDCTWKTLTGTIPALVLEETVVTGHVEILNHLRKQKYNADYDLSAKQGADTLAFIALLEEKLYPALLHTFWVDAENYSNVTRPWFASRIPFPLNFYLPGRKSSEAVNRILLTQGRPPLYSISEIEAKIYSDAKECLNLLSYRLGSSEYFFGNTPTSLDAFIFGFLGPLHKIHLPSGQLQQHLKQLTNLCHFCDNIISTFFMPNASGFGSFGQEAVDANLQKLTQLVNKESNLIEKMDDNLRSSPQHRSRKSNNMRSSRVLNGGDESSVSA
ncbi:metaxin-3 [Polypterus senegalus]|uniref:metaxin-3 n=1 Tax=Polypterus senegalus TaxID=55291 RepID=UPI001962F389|nr:metaxin-3 [Polypterus senegalus]